MQYFRYVRTWSTGRPSTQRGSYGSVHGYPLLKLSDLIAITYYNSSVAVSEVDLAGNLAQLGRHISCRVSKAKYHDSFTSKNFWADHNGEIQLCLICLSE